MLKSPSKPMKPEDFQLLVALPKEIWIQIWGCLDFQTLQKMCTRVSKKWFEDIRNSVRLSGKLTLKTCTTSYMKIDDLTVDDINGILSNWMMLKVLHVPSEIAMAQIGINLNAHTLLRKIIVPKRVPVPMKELEDWGKVSEVCFDPKQGWAPITMQNVAGLEIQILHVQNIPEILKGDICQRIESLTLVDHSLYCENTSCNQYDADWPLLIANFLESESILSLDLKSLKLKLTWLKISQLPKLLEIIETKKKFEISAIISVDAHEENAFYNTRFDTVEDYFKYARNFIDEKLPIESTEFEIKEEGLHQTWILKKTKGRRTEIYDENEDSDDDDEFDEEDEDEFDEEDEDDDED